MAKIALISCASKKKSEKAKAKNLYESPLFKLSYEYASFQEPDKIFILSAKYGLLETEEEIEPYDLTLNKMSKSKRKEWVGEVIEKLKEGCDLNNDFFMILAGEKYRKLITPYMKNYKIIGEGLGVGKKLKFYKDKTEIEKKCRKIHEIFNSLKRINFPFDELEIPKNGVYVLFEKGEKRYGKDRIVRIGTHAGKDQLSSRLKQHFINENKDRSIFRKNIGRAMLNKEKDPFLKFWEIDMTPKENRNKFEGKVDKEKLMQIEKKVSGYIQSNLDFVVFEVNEKGKRLELESKIISTLSLCDSFEPSKQWFGNFSPKEKIKQIGLWQVNELDKEPLSWEDIDFLEKVSQPTQN